MRYLLAFLLASAAASSAFALDPKDCADYRALAALYEVRSELLERYPSTSDVNEIVDRHVEAMREPTNDGGYRWVDWVRPSGDGPVEKKGHTVNATQGTANLDVFETTFAHTYAVRVVVPRKRSLLNANAAVWVGTVRVRYSVDGRTRTKEQAVNAWLNPDTSRTIDLEAIADRVDVSTDVATAAKNAREALVEIHGQQAVMRDDPANPAYDAIRLLSRVRGSSDAYTIDSAIASLERDLFPGADPMPLLDVITDLRRVEELLRGNKDDDREKAERLLRDALRKLQ
jgi:hypothetical protein